MSYHGPLPGDDDGDDLSSARVVGVVLAQFGYVAGILLRIIAIPMSLGYVLIFGILLMIMPQTLPEGLLFAQILFGASVVLLMMTIGSFFYRWLRAPAAILSALMIGPIIVAAIMRSQHG